MRKFPGALEGGFQRSHGCSTTVTSLSLMEPQLCLLHWGVDGCLAERHFPQRLLWARGWWPFLRLLLPSSSDVFLLTAPQYSNPIIFSNSLHEISLIRL